MHLGHGPQSGPRRVWARAGGSSRRLLVLARLAAQIHSRASLQRERRACNPACDARGPPREPRVRTLGVEEKAGPWFIKGDVLRPTHLTGGLLVLVVSLRCGPMALAPAAAAAHSASTLGSPSELDLCAAGSFLGDFEQPSTGAYFWHRSAVAATQRPAATHAPCFLCNAPALAKLLNCQRAKCRRGPRPAGAAVPVYTREQFSIVQAGIKQSRVMVKFKQRRRKCGLRIAVKRGGGWLVRCA